MKKHFKTASRRRGLNVAGRPSAADGHINAKGTAKGLCPAATRLGGHSRIASKEGHSRTASEGGHPGTAFEPKTHSLRGRRIWPV